MTKKDIIKTLRTYDITKICRMYKEIHGEVPTEILACNGTTFKCLNCYEICKWAVQYSTSRRMRRKIIQILCTSSHRWKHSIYDMQCVYGKHGYYKPTRLMEIVDYLKEQCSNPHSNYAKRPMLGYTHLYFCSPEYGHSDYNKWCALPIKGNERFCELVIKYAEKHFDK